MTPERFRKIKSIAKQLNKLAKKADALELTLPNGGIVGSLLGSCADDLDNMLQDAVERELLNGKAHL
jgi:hypothetical protein